MFLLVFVAGNSKDLGDVEGDLHGGRKTLPMLVGVRATAWMTTLISVCVGGLVIMSYFFLHELGWLFMFFAVPGTMILVSGSIALLMRSRYNSCQIRKTNGLQAAGASLIMIGYLAGMVG
jgi:4-hydroxybenzoate polyprenyltransferase